MRRGRGAIGAVHDITALGLGRVLPVQPVDAQKGTREHREHEEPHEPFTPAATGPELRDRCRVDAQVTRSVGHTGR